MYRTYRETENLSGLILELSNREKFSGQRGEFFCPNLNFSKWWSRVYKSNPINYLNDFSKDCSVATIAGLRCKKIHFCCPCLHSVGIGGRGWRISLWIKHGMTKTMSLAVSLMFIPSWHLAWNSRFLCFCLFVLRLNVPVNNFSVMSGRSNRFLGNLPVLSGSKVSCSRTQQCGGRSRTPDLSLRNPTLYHWATALPSGFFANPINSARTVQLLGH